MTDKRAMFEERKAAVHRYVHENRNCIVKDASDALTFSRVSVSDILLELIDDGKIERVKPEKTKTYYYRSIALPAPENTFVPTREPTLPKVLLSSLWKPKCLRLV